MWITSSPETTVFSENKMFFVPGKANCVNFSSELFMLCLGKLDVQLLTMENRMKKVPVYISFLMMISQKAFS